MPKLKKHKKHRSAAQRAATKRMLAANRAKRAGRVAKRRTKRSKRVARVTVRKVRRSKRRVARVSVRRVRRSRRRARVHVKARRARRSSRRARRARRSFIGRVSINPALSLKGFIAPVTGVIGNLKDSLKSVSGIAGLAGGAIGAIAGGTIIARSVMPLALRFAPTIAGSPMGARAISVLCYYGAGYLLARFLPVNEKVKKGILAGAVAASIIEVIRPGSVQKAVAMVPIVGPMIAGNLGGIEPELGDYIDRALNGQNSLYGGAAYALGNTTFGETTFGEYSVNGLGEYSINGLGEYEMNGLGCSPAAQELVDYDDT